MSVTGTAPGIEGHRQSERLCVISSDAHVGPTMEQLRPYCPEKLRPEFDAFYQRAAEVGRAPTAGNTQAAEHREQMLAHVERSGEHDPDERLINMDRDGVAAEVVFHGSQNLNPLPFGYGGRGDRAQEAEGIQIYNRWLADFCSVQPARHKGLAQLPGWDPEGCVRTAEWARSAGLGGINLPTMRLEDLSWPAYTDPVWEPLWAASEVLDMPLVNHGAADLNLYRDPGPGRYALVLADGPWLARRVTWWLMFGGVFERHPRLKFIITEQPGEWPKYEIDYLQSVYESGAQHELRKVMHRSPAEIFRTNIFVGASFMSNREARMFVDLGIEGRALWGSDYPHIEGTWPWTLHALHATFDGVGPDSIRKMLSENAATAYGFELDALRPVADRIGPTLEEVRHPPGEPVPELRYSLAFRSSGAWS
jgi:predicted TIM-barrel fold metal-dependent hydrolase